MPFGFAGAGAMTVDPGWVAGISGGSAQGVSALEVYYEPRDVHRREGAFTKPAATFGGGLVYHRVPGAPLELFFEGKALVFQWDAAGFDQTHIDVTYSLGVSYRASLR